MIAALDWAAGVLQAPIVQVHRVHTAKTPIERRTPCSIRWRSRFPRDCRYQKLRQGC